METMSSLEQVQALKKRYELIQQVKKEILTPDDFVELSNKSKATRKSGWLKYAVAFGLSFEIVSERKEVDPVDTTKFAYHITVRCKAPAGDRFTEAVGSCTLNEKSTFTTEHIVRAMADTRATERAIVKMLGTNEMAADDLQENDTTGNNSISSNFCKSFEHIKDHDDKANKCKKCGKLVRMPQ
jgi:hypothetical protein